MEFKNLTYSLLLLFIFIVPLVLSFEKQVQYYRKWKYLLPSIIITGAFFLLWDIRFEEANIWRFNNEYTLGLRLLGLPVEEWLFFLVVPYASVFIYEVVKLKLARFEKANLFVALSLFVLLGAILLTWFNREKPYTFLNFLFLSVYLGYTIFRNRFKPHYTKFYLAWGIALVPFLIVSGLLTGLPVVEYYPGTTLGVRLFTIPVENVGYFFLLFLMTVTIYENLAARKIF